MLKKLGIILAITGLGLVSNVAWANNQAKINLAKKVYKMEEYSSYADANFKKLIKEAVRLEARYMHYSGEPLGCELVEHYDLGIGNGGSPNANTFKYKVLSNGDVQVTFGSGSSKTSAILKMTCHGAKCEINDVISYGQSARKNYTEVLHALKTQGNCGGEYSEEEF